MKDVNGQELDAWKALVMMPQPVLYIMIIPNVQDGLKSAQ